METINHKKPERIVLVFFILFVPVLDVSVKI